MSGRDRMPAHRWSRPARSCGAWAAGLARRLWVLALACGGAAGAERAQPPDLTQLSLEELLTVEIPSVQAASRYAQKVTDAPASVTIVTAEEIWIYGHRTLADILRSVRGLYTSNDRNYTYLGVRGFSRPGDYNSRILLLVDGHRVNDNVYFSALFGNDFVLDVDLIDHVEIVRGPGSSLYGTSALFAVVNVVTKNVEEIKGLELAASAASFDTAAGRVSYGHTMAGGASLLLSASVLDSDGQSLFYEDFDDPATHDGFAENADYESHYSGFARLAFKNYTVEAAYVSREKGIPTGSFGTVFNDPRSKTIDERAYLDLGYTRSFASRVAVEAHLYYDEYYYRGDYVYDYPPVTVNRDRTRGSWLGYDGRLALNVGEKHTVTAGTELQKNLSQDQENYDVEPFISYVDSRKESTNWALYVQDEIRVREKVVVYGGLRFDHYGTFGGTTHPRLALIYKPDERTAFKALYGTAFRAPNPFELHYGSPQVNQKSNPDLDPETITTEELAVDRYLDKGVRLAASLFRYRIDDLITLQTDPSDGLLVYRNVDESESKGFGVECEKRWTSRQAVRTSYEYQRSRDVATGRTLTNSPRHLARANLTVPLHGERLAAGLEIQYESGRRTLDSARTSGFLLSNLTLTSRKLWRGLHLSASAYNLFDEAYENPGSEEHVQDVIPQDGRNYRFKVLYGF